MATANVTGQSPLDVIREEIIQVFERILSEVIARRDELLEQVSKMKIEFGRENISVVESMRGLKEMRTYLEKMSVKQNLAMKKQQESLADIDSDIKKLKIELSNKSKFQFNCSINQLIEQVKQFGEVIDVYCVITQYRSMYSMKLTAVQEITVTQDFQFSESTKLHIDYDKQLLYVLTYFDKTYKFQIYDRALNLKEERDLCYEWPKYEPTISAKQIKELFYILFNKHILVFNKEGKNIRSIFQEEGKLKNPTTFYVDLVGNIIVTDSATNSIKFFSPEGDLFHTIGEDTEGSDEVAGATDIVAYNGKVIVSTSNGSLRIF